LMATKIGQHARYIAEMNPWWRAGDWRKRDQDLKEATDSGLVYRPDALSGLTSGALYLLRGPRRVGKTVTVKQTVADLLDRGVPPKSVVRMAVDGWSASELRTAIQNVALPPTPEGAHRWWFIDEVTAVTGDWATEIKTLRDNDPDFRAATVVLTGSSAAALTAASGVLAGRRGHVADVDRTLLPMGFRTFASTLDPSLNTLPRITPDQIHSQAAAGAYEEVLPWLNVLIRLWETYLEYGGYPPSVAAAKANQPIPKWFVKDLFDVMHRDAFAKSQLDGNQTSALVERIWQSIATSLNEQNVGASLGLDSKRVSRHVDYLRDAYLSWVCPQLDEEWVAKNRTQDKVYPIDPLIGRLAHLRNAHRSDLDLTVLAEAQLGLAMRRSLITSGTSWTEDSTLFYFRTSSRQEVDFVSEHFGGAAIESKYIDDGKWASESVTLTASPYRGIVATRSVLDLSGGDDSTWAVPAAFLAVLIDS
jgi:predicted AAA+ superfamily ATPase